MNRAISTLAASLLIASSLAVSAIAAPSHMHTMPAEKTCPICHMHMTTHRSAMATEPVKIKGVTYYCCAKCGFAKPHSSHSMHSMHSM